MDLNQNRSNVSIEAQEQLALDPLYREGIRRETLRENLKFLEIFVDFNLGIRGAKFRKRSFDYELIGGV